MGSGIPSIVLLVITYAKVIALAVCGYKLYDTFGTQGDMSQKMRDAAPYAIGLFLLGGSSFLGTVLGLDGQMMSLLSSWQFVPQ
jgi:hypothetical protein